MSMFLKNLRRLRLKLILQEGIEIFLSTLAIFLFAFLLSPVFYYTLNEIFPFSLIILLSVIFFYFLIQLIIRIVYYMKKENFYKKLRNLIPPVFADDVFTAEELSLAMHDKSIPFFSGELAYAHVNSVADKLRRFYPQIPLLTAPARMFFKITFVLIIALLIMNNFTGVYKKSISALSASAILHTGEIVGSIDIKYTYPSYSGLPPAELKNTDGNIEALKGTVAELKVFPLVKTNGGEIVISDGERIPLNLEKDRLIAKLNIEKSAEYSIELRKGRRILKDSVLRTITVDNDAMPEIDAYPQREQSTISPQEALSFSYSARDDFGIGKITFSCESNSGRKYNVTVKELLAPSKSVNGEYIWKVDSMNLRKGNEVTCFLSAFDNDTISGPKEGRSRYFYFKVGAFDIREQNLEKLKELFEGTVNVLANLLEREGKTLDRKFIKNLQTEINEIKELTESTLRSLKDNQGKMNEVILETDGNLEFVRQKLIKALEMDNNALVKDMDLITEKIEDTVLSLYTIIKFGKLELLMDTAQDILSYQQSLLDDFKKGHSDELLNKIQQMESQLAELFTGLAGRAGSISHEFINIDALKEMGSLSIYNKLEKIKSLIKQGKIEEAKKLYEEFMSEFAKMVTEMQEFLNSTTLKEFSEFMKKLENIQAEIKRLRSREAKITSALKKTGSPFDRNIHEWLKKELEKVDRLIAEVEELGKDTGLNNFKEAKRRAELIRSSLSGLNLFDALKEARATLGILEALRFLPEIANENVRRERLNEGIELNKEIISDIENLLKNLSASIDEKARQKLKALADEQGEIEKKTRELSSELEKSQAENELTRTPLPGMLKGASEFMKSAKERLKDGDQHGGFENANEALKQLGKIDDYIEEMKSGEGMPFPIPILGYRESGSGYGATTGRVELPGEQESAYQKEIKEELLKAIRGGLPEKLEEENRKYIKELLK